MSVNIFHTFEHSHFLIFALITLTGCSARSTKVSAQYSVSDGNENNENVKTFNSRGIVEDASVVSDGILNPKLSNGKFRQNPLRTLKKRPETNVKFPSSHNEQFISSDFSSESPLKETSNEGKAKIRKVRGKIPSRTLENTRSSFKISSHQTTDGPFEHHKVTKENENNFKPITKKYNKFPAGHEDSIYTYSTLNYGDNSFDNSDVRTKPTNIDSFKASPAISTSSYNFEQSFGGGESSYDDASTKNYFKTSPSYTKSSLKLPEKLIKSPEDDFRSSPFYDFSIKPGFASQQRTPSSTLKYDKFKTDLGVKSLAIRATKNKYDPQVHGGFQPSSFHVKDFSNLRGSEFGSGIASPGQIRTYYEREGVRNNNQGAQSGGTNGQYQQFLKSKEDKRLEKLVEQQFKLQRHKQIAKEKEAELKAQQRVLQRQKEKLLKVEKQLNDKVTKETSRQKRRPQSQQQLINSSPRRQRNPGPLNLTLLNGGKKVIPLRSVNNSDGTYRVSFNINH